MWTIAVSGEKKLQIQKYPDTCGRGLNGKLEIISPSDEMNMEGVISEFLMIFMWIGIILCFFSSANVF